MRKHTPGRWTAHKYPDTKTWTVAALTSVASKIKTEDDARLIAAAPDLLNALDQAYSQIIEFLNEGDFKREVIFDAGYIVNALKKARGES